MAGASRVGVLLSLTLLVLAAVPLPSIAVDATALWSGLRDGEHVVLMRHALAPGTGDPNGFTLGDCDTQRNLSARGREQAAAIGDLLREQGIERASVYTSQWCRCRETAELLELGPVVDLPTLNSFFRRFALRDSQTTALREWLAAQPPGPPLVLVTHQVNITALTGLFPASGELIFLRLDARGEPSVLGRIATN